MLFQPSNISPSEINNSGTVDLSQGLTVSWQVNGDSPMVAYKIVFYKNDAASTLLYDTGKVSLSSPYWGINWAGQVQYYSASFTASALSANGIVNGEEYKFIITQWWSDTESIEQSTASLLLGRDTPVVSISNIASPLDVYSYSFSGTYSQAQGDALRWVQWQICEKDGEGNKLSPFLDTGRIYGTGELRVDYEGFLNDTDYSIILNVETENGAQGSSGWVDFSVEYAVSTSEGSVSACQTKDGDVVVSWERIISTKGYDVYRLTEGENVLEKIATVDDTVGQIRDWSACSGCSYTYYVFPTGPLAYLSEPVVSNTVQVKFWMWNIIEAAPNTDGTYTAVASYMFRYGMGGVKEGSFSNNNAPQIQKNFTKYPTRQPETANYLSGSVSGYIGTVDTNKVYSDSLAQARALRNLSVSNNTLFLRDPEGHFINIHTEQPVTVSIDHKSAVMPHTVTISWVEVGDTEGIKIISTPEDSFYPIDDVLYTTISVDAETGQLIWNKGEGYSGGSILSLVNGNLVQTVDVGYIAAEMSIENTNELVASVDMGGGS